MNFMRFVLPLLTIAGCIFSIASLPRKRDTQKNTTPVSQTPQKFVFAEKPIPNDLSPELIAEVVRISSKMRTPTDYYAGDVIAEYPNVIESNIHKEILDTIITERRNKAT